MTLKSSGVINEDQNQGLYYFRPWIGPTKTGLSVPSMGEDHFHSISFHPSARVCLPSNSFSSSVSPFLLFLCACLSDGVFCALNKLVPSSSPLFAHPPPPTVTHPPAPSIYSLSFSSHLSHCRRIPVEFPTGLRLSPSSGVKSPSHRLCFLSLSLFPPTPLSFLILPPCLVRHLTESVAHVETLFPFPI
ncbi:uncharacterized protein BJX67DRAFT_234339 [Aspergillus lucknowensis]|uniref:Uncharacterized protein n=1 Tax=Aspergillus lucknowensis TaxID=176173 RepID=A0ABR4LK32_9EURO